MLGIKRTWMLGGAALILSGVAVMLNGAVPGGGPDTRMVLSIAAGVIYLSGAVILAIGFGREASVVARRPLGIGAIVVFAVWPLVVPLLNSAVFSADVVDPGFWQMLGYLDILVRGGAGLIAAVQIARAGVVPHPWRWAPMWALVISAIAYVAQLSMVFALLGDPAALQAAAQFVFVVAYLGALAGTLGLGILALVLAARTRPDTVVIMGGDSGTA